MLETEPVLADALLQTHMTPRTKRKRKARRKRTRKMKPSPHKDAQAAKVSEALSP